MFVFSAVVREIFDVKKVKIKYCLLGCLHWNPEQKPGDLCVLQVSPFDVDLTKYLVTANLFDPSLLVFPAFFLISVLSISDFFFSQKRIFSQSSSFS